MHHVDTTQVARVREVLSSKTAMVLLETPTNPLIKIVDIPTIAKATHEFNDKALVIVDNTMLSPMLSNPLDLGADIVYESGTKYLSGHHDIMPASSPATTRRSATRCTSPSMRRAAGSRPTTPSPHARHQDACDPHEKQQTNAQTIAEFLKPAALRCDIPG